MKSSKYFVLLATVPGLAVAQECGDIEDNQERLACYDALHKPGQAVREAPASLPAPVPAAEPVPEAPPVPDTAPAPAAASAPAPEPEPESEADIAPDAPADNFGLKEVPEKSKQIMIARIEKIETAGNVDYLYLDNGQVWRETGGDSGVRFKRGKMVTITEGALASYDLKMEGRNRKAKVKRVR